MKIIVLSTTILALGLVNQASADPRYSDDYRHDSHVEIHGDVHHGPDYHEEGIYVPRHYHAPSNLRIVAASREDQYIADRIIQRAMAEHLLGPGAPPVSLNVRNGRVHWYGAIASSRQHRDLIAITRHTRGVRDINDELQAR
jgi:hypothetical protein